jgi:hypothetical protein
VYTKECKAEVLALALKYEKPISRIAVDLGIGVSGGRSKAGGVGRSDRGDRGKASPSVWQSMSRKGNCWDNAGAELFFKTLKRELETLDGKHTASEVRQSVFIYLDAYYNRVRIHSVLDYVAPMCFTQDRSLNRVYLRG